MLLSKTDRADLPRNILICQKEDNSFPDRHMFDLQGDASNIVYRQLNLSIEFHFEKEITICG